MPHRSVRQDEIQSRSACRLRDSQERYPVLYLLHGLTSNYTLWAAMNVPQFAANYKLIVVMPDVGNSWYVNWAESDASQKNHWEDYIIKDLVGYIDDHYRTIASREGARSTVCRWAVTEQ